MNITEAKEILGDEFRFTVEDTNRIVQHLKLPKDAKILDVGTGIGSLAITLRAICGLGAPLGSVCFQGAALPGGAVSAIPWMGHAIPGKRAKCRCPCALDPVACTKLLEMIRHDRASLYLLRGDSPRIVCRLGKQSRLFQTLFH